MLPPHPGGSAISAGQLIVGLAGLGHTIRAVAPITPEALRAGDRFAARHPALRVTRFPLPFLEVMSYVAPPDEFRGLEHDQLWQIVPALIAEERPDLILIGRESFAYHVPELASVHALPNVLMVRGNPTLAILRGTYAETPARHFLEQYRKADLIITPAQHLASGLQRLGFERVKVILNAVDLCQFAPRPKDQVLLRELAIEDGDIVVMLVANLHPRKRPLDLVNSAEIALRQDPRLVYVIVGDGVLRQNLEQACQARGLLDRFRFVGWVDYPQVQDYVNLADVVVLPSEGEGLARIYLETQACGRVLLASEIPPAREVIEHGESGLLFRTGDVHDLADKTLLAARDAALRASIGRRARQRVQAHSIDAAVTAYSATLEEVVRQRRN